MLPTDESKPSTAKVTLTPILSSATTATDCSTLSKLLIRRNAGSRDWKKRTSAARTKKIAYRRRKWATTRSAESVGTMERCLACEAESVGTVERCLACE